MWMSGFTLDQCIRAASSNHSPNNPSGLYLPLPIPGNEHYTLSDGTYIQDPNKPHGIRTTAKLKLVGYPERFAQEALGHNSKAIHRAYARKAQVRLPSLESYEKQNMAGRIIPFLPPLPKPEANGHSFSAAG
jgi:hypothetical protein